MLPSDYGQVWREGLLTAAARLESRMRKLEQRLESNSHGLDVWIRWCFTTDFGKPHGRYGFHEFNLLTQETRAVPEAEEARSLRRHYETELPAVAKREHAGYSWATFEDFLKSHECKCEKCQSPSKEEIVNLMEQPERVSESQTEKIASEETSDSEKAETKEMCEEREPSEASVEPIRKIHRVIMRHR